jgi:hypothetical protein
VLLIKRSKTKKRCIVPLLAVALQLSAAGACVTMTFSSRARAECPARRAFKYN